jgi:creatinine amidohydrolase
MSTVRMDCLSWPEYQARVREEAVPVLLPVGATEQHGPHLPLGTDALLATAVAEQAAVALAGLARRPAYGSNPSPGGGGSTFPGLPSGCADAHR